MKIAENWVEALNINPEKLNQWSSDAPPGKPLLVWCLEEGHISAQEYLLWASARYALPILSSAFFESGGLDPKFLAAQRHGGSWSPWCYPVAEWDGIIWVACAEPPQEGEHHAEIRYILADPRAMLEAWEVTGNSSPRVKPAPDVPPEMPFGISAEAKAFTLNLADDIMPGLTPRAQPRPPEPVEYASPPPELHFPVEDTAPDEEPQQSDVAPPPPAAPQAAAPTSAAAPKTTATAQAAAPATPPAPSSEDTGFTRVRGEDSVVVQDLGQATALHRFATPGVNLDLGPNEANALKKAFHHVRKTYKNCCLLRFVDTNAKVYKADETLNADVKAAQINLGFPSFLRIVHKTNMPYHGYLVDTPTHADFFRALGLPKLPSCVTAVPLKVNGQVWGALVALGGEDVQSLEHLSEIESVAQQLVTALGPAWVNAAA